MKKKHKRMLANDLKRWYPLIKHKVQKRLVKEKKRFKVVPAGRRSGKTERAKRYLAKIALGVGEGQDYFIGAPTFAQVKKIYWKHMKQLCLTSVFPREFKPSESELIIKIPNMNNIHLIGLDKPERFEGIDWAGGIIDEIGNVKEDAVKENIMPALDTFNPLQPDYKPWCWFIGVPEGLNHYYEMAEAAKLKENTEWGYYHWKSSDILPPEVIEAAKRLLSPRQFRQEYEGSFETVSGRIYEDYNQTLNYTQERIQPHETIYWCHDQNFTPLSSAICVRRDIKINKKDPETGLLLVNEYDEFDSFYVLDEIVLNSAISKQSAIEFCERYKDHENKTVYIYGDPAGRAGEKHGHKSDYTEIENTLSEHGWIYERRVARAHPSIKDRQNSLRALICNALGERRFFVNPAMAIYAHKGLLTVQTKKGSSFQEDQSNEYQHITTAMGYMAHYEYPVDDFVMGEDIFKFSSH